MQIKSKQTIESQIKDFALKTGFDACGISKSHFINSEEKHFEDWIKEGFHAGLSYMERNRNKRLNPALLHEGTKSIISVLLSYFPEKKQNIVDNFIISSYAYGKDYHVVMKEKLYQLSAFIKEFFPHSKMRVFVDSAPVLDRYWAKRAGLGWIGKNSLLINKNLGSFFFIGEILLDAELNEDIKEYKSYCGNCTKCIDACPTGAIEKPYIVNSKKCISYHTIESKEEMPSEIANKSGNRIFGCEICQDVCPWNSKAEKSNTPEFYIKNEIYLWTQDQWNQMTEEDFSIVFQDSALQRAGYLKIKNNIKRITSF